MFENIFASKPKEKTPDALKSEHLREGVPPIMAAILDNESLDEGTKEAIEEIRKNGDFADYYAPPIVMRENNMLNAGARTYVVSDCNENNKWSEGYWNCTGIAMVGVDKKTKKEISFLSHQDPVEFLGKYKENFSEDLTKKIRDLLQKSEAETVDAVVFGGHFHFKGEHEDSIKTVSEICKKVLGFEPVVLTGPSINTDYQTEVYLDTQKRRLYLVRPAQDENKTNQSYNPSNLEEEKKKWES